MDEPTLLFEPPENDDNIAEAIKRLDAQSPRNSSKKTSGKPPRKSQRKPAKKRRKKPSFKIVYNAPVTLTFALICILVMFLKNESIIKLFIGPSKPGTPYAFNFQEPLDYFRLILYVFGHQDWNHLLSNLSFLLLLGPILEERYGGKLLSLMIFTTAFITGVVNACFIPLGLMGASGIVFMMILLTSYSTIDKKKIPLTFILVAFLYLGKELFFFEENSALHISTLAHIIGGICGSIFGLLASPVKKTPKEKVPPEKDTVKK